MIMPGYDPKQLHMRCIDNIWPICRYTKLNTYPCRNKANDLKEQLTWWARPPEADWPTREQRLEWLEHALGEAQDIMRAMQSNGALDADLGTYVEIVQVSLSFVCQ